MKENKLNISEEIGTVSYQLYEAPSAKAILILAHGAGAGMNHNFMKALTEALNEQNISVFRFQFSYMEKGKKRPDSPRVSIKTIEVVTDFVKNRYPSLLIIGAGKSYGGRMSSHYASDNSDIYAGLVFFGFPLHAPGKPSTHRAEHLGKIDCPMLFLQGSRDKLATPQLINKVVKGLPTAEIINIEGADHSFKMLKSSGISDQKIIETLAKETNDWITRRM